MMRESGTDFEIGENENTMLRLGLLLDLGLPLDESWASTSSISPGSWLSSGFTTTNDVNGVTNSYFNDINKALSRLLQMIISASPTSSIISATLLISGSVSSPSSECPKKKPLNSFWSNENDLTGKPNYLNQTRTQSLHHRTKLDPLAVFEDLLSFDSNLHKSRFRLWPPFLANLWWLNKPKGARESWYPWLGFGEPRRKWSLLYFEGRSEPES